MARAYSQQLLADALDQPPDRLPVDPKIGATDASIRREEGCQHAEV
ncbi:MAG: hypothetical protein ACLP0J_31275 [Solirubrobacteraceae bacterium]